MTAAVSRVAARRAAALACACAGALVAACDEDAPEAPNVSVARLKAVHAVANGPAVDVVADSAVGPVATGLAAGAASDYVTVTPGAARRVVVSAGGATLVEAPARLDFAREYSAVVTGRASGTPAPSLLVLTDTNAAPAAGQFRLRLVHAAATVGNVDVYVTAPTAALPATATAANVAFRGNSPYLARDTGSYRIRVTPAGNRTNVLVDLQPVRVPLGAVATGYVTDAIAPATAPGVRLVIDRAQ